MANLKPYIIRQGDYLTKLAFVHGFDAVEAWDDPRNDDLRKTRTSMDMLAPGDIVYIPDKPREGLSIAKGTSNRYTAKVPKVEVTLVFKNADGTPLAGEPYEVRGLAEGSAGPKTDDAGKVTFQVPVTVREVTVFFPERHFAYTARVGDLDPGSEASGVRQRLQHLGHFIPAPAVAVPEDEAIGRAVAAFQASKGREPTGELDDETRQALLAEHGA